MEIRLKNGKDNWNWLVWLSHGGSNGRRLEGPRLVSSLSDDISMLIYDSSKTNQEKIDDFWVLFNF